MTAPDASNQNDPLDQLLSNSAADSADVARIERLERQWLKLTKRRLVHQRVCFGASCSALIILACVMVWFPKTDSSKTTPMLVHTDFEKIENHTSSEKADHFTIPVYHQLVRNAGERYFQSRRGQHQTRRRKNKFEIHKTLSPDTVADSNLDPIVLLNTIREQSLDAELDLIQFLQTGDLNDEQTKLGIELLAKVASQRSTPILWQLYQQRDYTEMVAPLIGRLVPPQLVFQLASSATSEKLQSIFATALIDGDTHALTFYLKLVDQPQTSRVALRCMSQVAEPPTAQLLRFLFSTKRTVRLTAALSLAQIDDRQVTRQLVRLTLDFETRFPAMVALVISDDPAAKQFVQYARSDRQLADSVQAANSLAISISQHYAEKG